MSQQKLLAKVLRVLDEMGIDSMLTGSWASSLQGVPRATHDIDLVVNLRIDQIDALVGAFPPPDYYLDPNAVREAVERKRMFNLLDTVDGDKIDFWILTDSPFDRSRFARREEARLGDVRLEVSTPEDTILAKLRWAEKSGGSEKQFGDALQIYNLQGVLLDQDFLRYWAGELKLESWLERLLSEARPIDDPREI